MNRFVLRQKLSNRELIGCVLAFAAIMMVQLPANTRTKAEKEKN